MEQFELGFTPYNLKKLLADHNISAIEASEIIGVHKTAFYRYMNKNQEGKFATMSHEKWVYLRDFLEKEKKG